MRSISSRNWQKRAGTVKNLIPLDLNLLLQIGDQKERKVEETKQ